MIGDAFVIDAVAHGMNFTPENWLDERAQHLAEMTYHSLHVGFQPAGVSKWTLSEERFRRGTDPEMIAHAFFAESQTDICIYHSVPLYGLFRDGLSPLWVGREMRELHPGRVLIYGGISPFQEGHLEEVDRLIEEERVSGLKLYPGDIVDGRIRDFRLDDEEAAFPIIERARAKGIKNIAIHKAQAISRFPIAPFGPRDIEGAALAFPDVSFEIVHGGWAFLEETASQVHRFPNVSINLESTSAYLVKAPRRFAEIVGSMLVAAGSERLLWATGAMVFHPRPFIEAFMDFEMPRDLVEGYGFPEITYEDKVNILGRNQARLLGLDIGDLEAGFAGDAFSGRDAMAEPWSGGANRLQSGAA